MDTPSEHDEVKLLKRSSFDAESLHSSEMDRQHANIRQQDLAKRRRLHLIRIILDIVVAACLGVVIFLLVQIQTHTASCGAKSDEYSVMHRPPAGSDLSGVVPIGEVGGRVKYKSWDESGPLAVKTKAFHEKSALNTTLQNWEKIMKPFVKPDDSWDHRGPEIPLTHELFEVSAFHQIHCLSGILEDFSYMAMGIPQADLPSVTRLEHLDWSEHNAHCFNYVMNAIMCFADTTTEGATPGNPPVVHKEAMHVCNDWEALFEWSEKPEHRMPEIDGLRAVN